MNLGTVATGERLQSALARLGSEGWELITVMDKASNWINWEKGFALFKRPVDPDDPEPREWAVLEREAMNPRPASGSTERASDDSGGWM